MLPTVNLAGPTVQDKVVELHTVWFSLLSLPSNSDLHYFVFFFMRATATRHSPEESLAIRPLAGVFVLNFGYRILRVLIFLGANNALCLFILFVTLFHKKSVHFDHSCAITGWQETVKKPDCASQ